MVIEISVTKKLMEALKLNLNKTLFTDEDVNHFYADIITKDRQKSIMFMNTYCNWICFAHLKDFKKNALFYFKICLRNTLLNEGIQEYIINNYLNQIEDINFSLTNSISIVSRMSSRKKEVHFIYDRYYNAPDVVEISRDRLFNATFLQNYLFPKNMDKYIIPMDEMGYFLTNNYSSSKMDKLNHSLYLKAKSSLKDDYSPPLSYSGKSNEEIKNTIAILYKNQQRINTYQLLDFYSFHPSPSLEDCYDYLFNLFDLCGIDSKKIKAYAFVMGVDLSAFDFYCQYHSKHYVSRLVIKLDYDA